VNERFYIDELRERFLMKDFDERIYQITAEEIVDYARSCGEEAPRYTDPTHPDFQAPPTFAASFQPGRRLPDDFPKLPGLGMDAGKAVAPKAPIRPDVRLTARTHLHDLYVKTGRSGRMTFMVTRMEIYDPAGTQLATADTRIVIREKPEE
jgi:hypothetical protein